MTTPYMGRLPKGADLLESLNALCAEENITRGQVQLLGALEKGKLGFYRQIERKYVTLDVDEHVEIVSGTGNISIKDGKPFVHLHVVLSYEDGSCIAGHTMPGCIVFACEVVLTPIDGDPLVRGFDEPTGLPLWEQE